MLKLARLFQRTCIQGFDDLSTLELEVLEPPPSPKIHQCGTGQMTCCLLYIQRLLCQTLLTLLNKTPSDILLLNGSPDAFLPLLDPSSC